MSDEQGTTRRRPSGKVEDVKMTPSDAVNAAFVPDWAEGFDVEDFPDAVSVGPGEQVRFQVLSSNIIPLLNKRTNVMEDTEAVQLLILEGTTATDKVKTDSGEYVPTGTGPIPIDEVRTLWINSKLLRDMWIKWDVQNDDEGIVKFLGTVEPKRPGGSEYQKWVGKFNKKLPRQSAAR
jgi:hypothetical protein